MDKNALLMEINTILGNRKVAEAIEASTPTPASVAAKLQQPGNTLVDDAVLESLGILEWEDVFQLAAFGMYPPEIVIGLNRALAEGTASFRGAWGDFAREFEVPEEMGRGTFLLLNKVSPDDNVLTRVVSWSAKLVDEADSRVKTKLAKAMPAMAEAMFTPASNLAKAEKEKEFAKKYMNPHMPETDTPVSKSQIMTTRMWQDPKKQVAKQKKDLKGVDKEIQKLTTLAKKAGSTPEEMFPMLYRDLMRERVRHSSMPIDGARVALAVEQGLSIVCATCEKYWGARDAGKPGHECLASTPCGSPIAGDVFHEYVGPMTQFDRFCFVCGQQATHALRVKGLVRVIGCCGEHVKMVQDLRAEGRNPTAVVIVGKNGESSSDERKPEKKHGTLKMKVV